MDDFVIFKGETANIYPDGPMIVRVLLYVILGDIYKLTQQVKYITFLYPMCIFHIGRHLYQLSKKIKNGFFIVSYFCEWYFFHQTLINYLSVKGLGFSLVYIILV